MHRHVRYKRAGALAKCGKVIKRPWATIGTWAFVTCPTCLRNGARRLGKDFPAEARRRVTPRKPRAAKLSLPA